MPGHCHRGRPGNASKLQGAYAGAAEVVRNTSGHTGCLTGSFPLGPKVFDRIAATMEKSQGMICPVSRSSIRVLSSGVRNASSSSGVSGNMRPLPFFVLPHSRRSQPPALSGSRKTHHRPELPGFCSLLLRAGGKDQQSCTARPADGPAVCHCRY